MSVRRDREKEAERREKIRYWTQQYTPPPLPLQKASQENLADKHLLLVARVSTPRQKSDLPAQITFLVQKALSFQATIEDIYSYVANGSDESHWKAIADKAGNLNVDGILFESACRAIRHPEWGWIKPEPHRKQVKRFTTIYRGRNLYTYLDSEASLEEIQKHQTERGQWLKGKGGAGNKKNKAKELKNRRKALIPVLSLMLTWGKSTREMSRILHIPEATIRYWLKSSLAHPVD